MKVLLFTSMPDGLDEEKGRLDFEQEQTNFIESFNPWVQEGWVELTVTDDGRFSHFQEMLKQEEFHLVCLSGHGFFKEDEFGEEKPKSYFLFEGEDGSPEAIEGENISGTNSGHDCLALDSASFCLLGISVALDLVGAFSSQV